MVVKDQGSKLTLMVLNFPTKILTV